MRVIKHVRDMQEEALANLRRDASVGFVPTMGALHAGHLSLIERANSENECTIVSIFVNPTQFNEDRDFDSYPRTLEQDLDKCEAADVDIVFAPQAGEIYSPRYQTTIFVQQLTDHLCGLSRGRGHFVGVCSVVAKLFNLVMPTRAYFGQKDAQQAVIIQRMVEDLNFPVQIVVCPIVREPDGLAMSSRNALLPGHLRKDALVLRQALLRGQEMIRAKETDAAAIRKEMSLLILGNNRVDLDYINIVSLETLADVDKVEDMVMLAGAIRLGEVRLIDNIIVGPDGPWEE